MKKHDELCSLKSLTVLKHGCPQCEVIARGRADGLRLAVEAVDKGGRAREQLIRLAMEHGMEL